MNISIGRSASHLAWSPRDLSYRKTGLPKEIPIQTVPLAEATFEHAGLGLSAATTHMLGKVAAYLGDYPAGKLVIRGSQNDTNKAGLNSQARVNLVKAYLGTQGIDVPRYVIKGPSANNRLVPRPALGTELIIEYVRNHRIHW